jgi:hypothetical protein
VNDLQTLFTVIFGIYFATTVATTGKFHPFDTTAIIAGDKRAFSRLVISFVTLNLLPFFYFVLLLRELRGRPAKLETAWMQALGVFFAALAVFGFYRLFIASMLMRRKSDKHSFVFYSNPEDLSKDFAKVYAEHRQLPPEDRQMPAYPVLWSCVLWLDGCLLMYFLLTGEARKAQAL